MLSARQAALRTVLMAELHVIQQKAPIERQKDLCVPQARIETHDLAELVVSSCKVMAIACEGRQEAPTASLSALHCAFHCECAEGRVLVAR